MRSFIQLSSLSAESECVGSPGDSSVIADAAMFVSMLGDDQSDHERAVDTHNHETNSSLDNSLIKDTANCVSSDELFSSATTKEDSVIVISSGSIAASQPEGGSQSKQKPTTLHESTSLFNSSDFSTGPVAITMATVATPTNGNEKPMNIERTGSPVLPWEPRLSDTTNTIDTSDDELSGNSSDDELSGNSSDDVEFLSNREYLKRKKRCHKDAPNCKKLKLSDKDAPSCCNGVTTRDTTSVVSARIEHSQNGCCCLSARKARKRKRKKPKKRRRRCRKRKGIRKKLYR